MSAVLALLAFPGLPLIAYFYFHRAMRPYIAWKVEATSYREPTIDDVVERGIFGTYRALSDAEYASDAEVRAGQHGERAQKLLAVSQHRLRIAVASLPVGFVLMVVLTQLIPRVSSLTGQSADTIATLVFLVGGTGAIGAVMLWSARQVVRSGHSRTIALGYLIGFVMVVLGAVMVARIILPHV